MSAIEMDERGFIAACPACGRKNRARYDAGDVRCGACKTALPVLGEPVEVPSVASFDALVRSSGTKVVVDFWAPWCGPCRIVAPELEKVARSRAGRLVVVKVNTDALPELGERFRIRSIPTMMVFQDGREIARTAGAMPAAAIDAFVEGS